MAACEKEPIALIFSSIGYIVGGGPAAKRERVLSGGHQPGSQAEHRATRDQPFPAPERIEQATDIQPVPAVEFVEGVIVLNLDFIAPPWLDRRQVLWMFWMLIHVRISLFSLDRRVDRERLTNRQNARAVPNNKPTVGA